MAKTFVPLKKKDVTNQLKQALLDGKIIRYDGYNTSVEVLPRELMSLIHSADNLFQNSGSLCSYYNSPGYKKEEINISVEARREVLNRLSEEYIVQKVRCSGSGCCQYATYAIYLEA